MKYVILYAATAKERAISDEKQRAANAEYDAEHPRSSRRPPRTEIPTCPIKDVRGPFDTQEEAEAWLYEYGLHPASLEESAAHEVLDITRHIIVPVREPGEPWASQ